MALYAAAVRRNPRELNYQIQFSSAAAQLYGVKRANRMLDILQRGTGFERCRELADRQNWEGLLSLWPTSPARLCIAFYATTSGVAPRRLQPLFERMLDSAKVPGYYSARVTVLAVLKRNRELEAMLRKWLAFSAHPKDRNSAAIALANFLRGQGRAREADALLRNLEQAAERGPPAAKYWFMTARLVSLEGDSLEAVANAAAEHALKYGSHAGCADVLHAAGARLIDGGEPVRAARLLKKADDCAVRTNNPYVQLMITARLGRALVKAARFDEAIPILQRALRLSNREDSRYWKAESYHNLAHAYEGKGEWPRARAAANDFVAAASRLPRQPLHIVSLRDAGIIHWNSGERAEARRYFEQMVTLIGAAGHDYQWAAEYFERVGDLPSARKFYLKSLTEAGDSARKFAGLTRVYLALGAYDSAAVTARYHDAALQTPEEVPLIPEVEASAKRMDRALLTSQRWARLQVARGNASGAAHGFTQAAELAFLARNHTAALSAANTALFHADRINAQEIRIRALTLAGASSAALGRHADAGRTFQRAALLAKKAGSPMIRADLYAAIGSAALERKNYRAALIAFDSAAMIRESMAEHFEESFDRVRFSSPFSHVFEESIGRIAATGDAARTFEWLARRHDHRSANLSTFQRQLGRNDIVLSYFLSETMCGVLMITRSAAAVYRLPAKVTEIRDLVQSLRAPISAYYGRVDARRARFDSAAAVRLARIVLAPVRDELGARTRLFIMADDALQLFPFDALITESIGTRPKFLIDSHEVVQILSFHAAGRVPRLAHAEVAVIATEVPGVRAEVASIAATRRTRTARSATETAASAALRSGAIVHFAVHGEANVRDPLLSHLQLQAGEGGDGILNVSEIGRFRSASPLVVLTACETINSKLFGGDGAMSIARAFLNAGTPAIVATQWSVGASASQFSQFFYRALTIEDAAQALRHAKLEMRKRPGASPLTWAPFVLVLK